MKVLGIIPARGNSKRLPRKNTMLFCGIPLIAWTILEAKKSKLIDRLIVSTEDEEIRLIARRYDCECFDRPKALSEDDTPSAAVVLNILERYPDFKTVTLLQPTSPLRHVRDIDFCINMGTGMSVYPSGESNGAVYSVNVEWFKKYQHFELTGFIMPEERCADIDTLDDFRKAEALMKSRPLDWDG